MDFSSLDKLTLHELQNIVDFINKKIIDLRQLVTIQKLNAVLWEGHLGFYIEPTHKFIIKQIPLNSINDLIVFGKLNKDSQRVSLTKDEIIIAVNMGLIVGYSAL